MGGAGHLVKRFFGSVIPARPQAGRRRLGGGPAAPGEGELWRQMSRADPPPRGRRGPAGGDGARLRGHPSRPRGGAAARRRQDRCRAGHLGRVIATLSAKVGGRDQADAWSESRGFTANVGLYLRHPELGAARLELAGSDPLTVSWAREHHLPEDQWTVPVVIGEALKAADDD